METMIEFFMGFSAAFLPALIIILYYFHKTGKERTTELEKQLRDTQLQLTESQVEVASLKRKVAETQKNNIALTKIKEQLEDQLRDEKQKGFRLQRKVLKKSHRADSEGSDDFAGYVYVISMPEFLGPDNLLIHSTEELSPHRLLHSKLGIDVAENFEIHSVYFHENAKSLEFSLWEALDEQKANIETLDIPLFKTTPEQVAIEMAKIHDAEDAKRKQIEGSSGEAIDEFGDNENRVVFRQAS